jgi:uncharacterized membrane protein YgcG
MALFTRRQPAGDDDRTYAPSPVSSPVSDGLPPIQLREWEIPAAYVVAVVVVVVAVLEFTVTTGKGAPKNPSVVLPSVALVAAAAQAISVRFGNRLITAFLGIVAGITVGYTKTPDSLSLLRDIGLFLPFIYGFVVIQRQSRAQRAITGPRGRRGRGAAGGGGGGRQSSKTPEATGPKANRRYTPPKAKAPEERSGRRR